MPRLRLGTVPYLNGFPLTWRLQENADVQLEEAPPAQLCREFKAGKHDLVLASVDFLLSHDDLRAVPGIGIRGAGPIRSVGLFHRKPLADCRTFCPDPASRTGNTLAGLFFAAQKITLRPVASPQQADLFLAIGDRALLLEMKCRRREGPLRYTDLASWWHQYTGFPMVFALWIGRAGFRPPTALLKNALAKATREKKTLFREAAHRFNFPLNTIRHYLFGNVRYQVTLPEQRGLERFLKEGQQAHLYPLRHTPLFYGK